MPILFRVRLLALMVFPLEVSNGDTIPVHTGIVAPDLIVIGMNQQDSAIFVFRHCISK